MHSQCILQTVLKTANLKHWLHSGAGIILIKMVHLATIPKLIMLQDFLHFLLVLFLKETIIILVIMFTFGVPQTFQMIFI